MNNIEPPVKLNEIPLNPGTYIMKNEKGKVIYVGKAKNLRNRVSSYFKNISSHTVKTLELVKNIRSIEFFICQNEIEALILENNLIKKHKPKYNIMLKDEKTYPYIKISKEAFPKIEIVRSTKKLDSKEAEYFGPYPMGIYFAVKSLLKIFPIRDCNRNMEKQYDRPCLKYYMNLCTGPCVYKDSVSEYNENVNNFRNFLKGHQNKILGSLEARMKEFSENMEFERAIREREKIVSLKKLLQNQVIEYSKEIDEDVFVIDQIGEKSFICVLDIREGKIINKNHIYVSLENVQEDDLFHRIFTAYYEKRNIPKNIILDKKYEEDGDLIKGWVKAEKNKDVKLYFPSIDSRRKQLLEMGYLNLNEEVEKYFKQKKILEEGLAKLKIELNLRKLPRRIDCFDISNIQGKDAVAAMTVAIDGNPDPSKYRHFKIQTKDTPDDFHMMREALTRRYSKIPDEEFPELILIDGGKGQLGVATEVIDSIDKSHLVDIISIAKREEEIFKSREREPYIFSKSDEALKILQRIRDEAHRFGITYHRKLRSKRNVKSFLDDIYGIGPKRKKELINKFGTMKNIKEASIEELRKIVPEDIAIKIKES